MKNYLKHFALMMALVFIAVNNGYCAEIGSPQNVKVKFYEFWVSPNADCSELTSIYTNDSPSYQDVTTSPSFGQVTVANGTYQCVAFKMSDVVKLTPDFTSDSNNCQVGVEITRDLFRGGDVSISPTGTTINGSGTNPGSPIENTMWVYLSTGGSDSNTGNSADSPALLSGAYVVNGDSSATMVWDFRNGIEDLGAECSPEGVVFGFR